MKFFSRIHFLLRLLSMTWVIAKSTANHSTYGEGKIENLMQFCAWKMEIELSRECLWYLIKLSNNAKPFFFKSDMQLIFLTFTVKFKRMNPEYFIALN